MTKEEILNGMSEAEFYKLYPTKQAWEMAFGGTPFGAGIMLANGGTPYYGGPIYPAQNGVSTPVPAMDADEWDKKYAKPSVSGFNDKPGYTVNFPKFNTRSAYNKFKASNPNFAMYSDADMEALGVNIPAEYKPNPRQKNYAFNPAGTNTSGAGLFTNNQGQQFTFQDGMYTPYTPVTTPVVSKKMGGMPCYDCGGMHMEQGGGLSRGEDYGSKKKPYPSVDSSDFAGSGRSYPIPTRADAIDALRLAGLHGRADVKSKVYAKYPDLKKAFGGDITQQGGNEDFIKQRNNNYTSFIKNNVMKNLQQEEFNKVHNAYMQAEYGYHMMPDGSMMSNNMMQFGAQYNPQNIALQDMYAQNINQYKNQRRKDFQSFGAMATDFVGQITAQDGRIVMPNWEYSNYVPQNDIRTGYALSKSDFAKLAKLEGQGKVTGAKFNYGVLGRVAPRMFGPKSIEVGYLNPNKGMFEDTKAPLKFDPEAPEAKWHKRSKTKATPPAQQDVYGPPAKQYKSSLEAGIRQTAIEKMMNPFSDDAQRQLNIMKNSGPGPQPLPTDNSWEDFMSKKNNAMAPYSEQFKAYGGLFKAQSGYENPVAFRPRIEEDDPDIIVPSNEPAVKQQTEAEALADVAGIQKRRQEQRDMFGPPMGDQPDLFATDTVKFKKKTTGVGTFLGKNSPLIADTLSSILEGKENRKNEQRMKDLMLADNAFLTTPMNAKNRGDYDPNSGMFRPDQKVPVQFPGYAQWGGFNTMQGGGQFDEGQELNLSPEEIADLKAQGYEIEELD